MRWHKLASVVAMSLLLPVAAVRGEDGVSIACEIESEYAKDQAIAPIPVTVVSESAATVRVAGLPPGLRFVTQSGTICGKPTKSGLYATTVTATIKSRKKATKALRFVVRAEGEAIVDAEAVLTDAEGLRVDGAGVPGRITGSGVYGANRKTITLRATASRGYVFRGWYADGEPVSQLASYALARPDGDVRFEARFVTADLDKSSVTAAVNGMEMSATGDGSSTSSPLVTNIWTGVYLEWPVAASALSATSVRVTGLPSGLRFADKPVVTRKTTGVGKSRVTTVVTNVPARTIYGTPVAASRTKTNAETGKAVAIPSAVKLTVTTAGGNSLSYPISLTVDPLPEQVTGTFTGGNCDENPGSATLTVAASGKISGKWISGGKTWTLSAKGFASGDAEGNDFTTALTAKSGKAEQTLPLAVTAAGEATSDRFAAHWANWKIAPWKALGQSFADETRTYYVDSDGTISEYATDASCGTVKLTLAGNGTAKAVGSFVTGTNATTGADILYKTSGSITLTPIDSMSVRAFVYFAPKGAFAGFAANFTITRTYSQEHWYHVCKPVIYLYPETDTTCRVTVELKGKLTCTYPDYGENGWSNFTAAPDGTLTFADGSRYYCLFWEGASLEQWDFSQGYCVKGSETGDLLADVLLEMGLTFREANEFIIYWLPLMQDNPYNVIAFQGENYLEAAKLEVEPRPDSVLRIFMAWRASERAVAIPAPVIAPFVRNGFTLVEWGGAEL